MQETNSLQYRIKHPDAVEVVQYKEYPISILSNAYIVPIKTTSSPYHAVFNHEKNYFFVDLYTKGTSYQCPSAAEIESVSCRMNEECITIDECAPLCGHGIDNFWHATMETVPKIVSLELTGFSGTYLLDRRQTNLIKYLELLGIPDSRILITQKIVLARRCYLAPALCHGCFDNMNLLPAAREAILSKITPNIQGGKRTYISRKGNRRVINEKEVRRILTKQSFKCVDMAELSLKKQITLAANSSILVGPHGAGMVLSLFQKPGSCVIELFSPHMTQTCIQKQVHFLNLNYYMLVERWPPYGRPYAYYENPSDGTRADMLVDPNLLRRAVERSIEWLSLRGEADTPHVNQPLKINHNAFFKRILLKLLNKN